MPKHAPYEDVVLGEPCEIRVFVSETGALVADCEFRGDTFGGQTEIEGLAGPALMTEVDSLVAGVGQLVYDELCAKPVFREEDENWVERVEVRAPWEDRPRRPVNGWIASYVGGQGPEVAAEEYVEQGEAAETRSGEATGGAAAVALSMSEMEDLARGVVPESVASSLMRARSTESLLSSAERVLGTIYEWLDTGAHAVEGMADEVRRAQVELAEVRRRYATGLTRH